MNFSLLPRSKKNIFPLTSIFLFFILIGVIFFGVGKTIILTAGLLVFVVIFFNPFIGLLILIFFDPLSNLIILPGFGNLTKIIGFYTLFIWLLNVLLYKKNIKTNRVFWFALAFLWWAALSILWAINPIISLSFIYRLIRYIGIYLLMINFLDSEEKFNWAIFAFIAGSFIMNLLGIRLFLKIGSDVVRTQMALMGQNPNSVGIILSIAIFCILHFLNSKSINYYCKIILSLIGMFFLIGLFFTQSRGSWIGFIICMSGIIIFTKRKRNINLKKIFIIVFFFLSIILSFNILLTFTPEKIEPLNERVISIFIDPHKALGPRGEYWKNGLIALSKNPILGVGICNFPLINNFSGAHNTYIAILCELGIVGLVIWMFLIFSLFKIAKSNKYFSLTIIILLFLSIISLKGTYYGATFYWYAFGIISATSNTKIFSNKEKSIRSSINNNY